MKFLGVKVNESGADAKRCALFLQCFILLAALRI